MLLIIFIALLRSRLLSTKVLRKLKLRKNLKLTKEKKKNSDLEACCNQMEKLQHYYIIVSVLLSETSTCATREK